jgi:hypothetical protein
MHYRCKAYHVVLALGLIGCFVAFSPVLTTPFRSDEWYIASFARNAPVTLETISQASSWELFGDPRFQPFSHLLLFLIHKVFGNAFVLFHLLSWVSHVIVGLLIYAIVKELHSDKMTAALCAILFVTGFSHFDTVSWTYHIYIIHQTICLLFGFWVALRDPSKLRWWQAVIGGVLVGFACYFYEAGLAIPILILVAMSCSKYETRKSGLGSNSRSFLAFVVCLIVGYGAFIGFHLQRVGSQISANIDTSSLITGGHNTLKGLWTQGVLGNLGFPPRYSFGDLFYLQGSEFEFLPILAIIFFLIAVVRNLRRVAQKSLPRTENRKYLLLIFLACAASYYGIIAIGRFNLYVVTQARYFYLPDAFLVLAFSYPMAVAGSLKLENHGKDSAGAWRRVHRIVLRPQTWAMCAVCVVIILNSYHIFGSCREIAQIVSPVRDSIEAVKDFSRTSKGTKRLYVDFVPRSMSERLFGGTHIALETCSPDKGILTRQVAKAEHTFTMEDGIISNPAFGLKGPDTRSFTLEFDYVMWGQLITVVNSPENTMRIRQWSARENEILLRLTIHVRDEQREVYVTARHPRRYVSHVVIQQQNDTIYIAEEGKVIAAKRVGNGEILWRDETLFLGTGVVFPPQFCYLENFFACVGKAKYNMDGVEVGDLLPGASLRAPMPALNSDPIYWKTD